LIGFRTYEGIVLLSATTYRILLRKAGKARIAIMVESPYHMYDQTRFSITEQEYRMSRNTRIQSRNGDG